MKNLEKIAIDTILSEIENSKTEMIQNAISAKSAAELAQQNFKEVATPLVNYAKEARNLLVEDNASDEAMQYFEERMSAIIKIPFTFRK